ncbi:MAG TPA: sulfurtransferase TusA family protein, partial [Nitrospiria bacterium]|nr:sulfurtransferase TusA family protein [Nitrospiria bacterium]
KSQNGHYTLLPIETTPKEAPAAPRDWKREEASGAFASWLKYNVRGQKQSGFNYVNVKIPLGDIQSDQTRQLADLVEQFTDGYLRVAVNQNFVLRWVHDADLPAVFEALNAAGLADAGAERIENIMACPGSDTCALSLTSSKGIGGELAQLFPPGDEGHSDLAGSTIKISGCQNSCAQHHLATIGLHGVGKKVGEKTAPFYEVHLGGSNTKVARQIVKVPAKRVPEAVKELLSWYRESRKGEETLEDFLNSQNQAALKKKLMPFTFLPDYDKEPEFYRDWGEETDFSTAGLGKGECAGGAYQMMEGFLFEADQEVYLAGVMAEADQTGHAVNKAYRSVVAAAKGLLVLEGIDSSVDAEVIGEAESHLIAKGTLPKKFAGLAERFNDAGNPDPSPEWVREKIAFAKDFVAECHKAFDLIGRDLNKKQAEGGFSNEGLRQRTGSDKIDVHFDLKGVACPINYVKTKLRMEEMAVGERIEVILDDGEPITNVPRSLKGDGQKILLQEKIDPEHHRIVVEKVN